jgi:uracil-DNA glycosylase
MLELKNFVQSYGNKNARLAIIGEAPGRQEASKGMPFVGGAGQELRSWLKFAGIDENDIYFANAISYQPPYNQIKRFCLPKKEADAEYQNWLPRLQKDWPDFPWPSKYIWPSLAQNGYIHPQLLGEIPRLQAELESVQPNLVLALGNTACWAVLNQTKITKIRGACTKSAIGPWKTLPSLHPAYILRNYGEKPIALADMQKAAREIHTPEFERPVREIWINPLLEDLEKFGFYIDRADYVGVDIETVPTWGIIKSIAFSVEEKMAIAIPFLDPRTPDGNYWADPREEMRVWEKVHNWLNLSNVSHVYQNGMYDMTWLWVKAGMTGKLPIEDTMLQAHAQQPELKRDLGTLGSIYTDEPAWKNEFRQHLTNKEGE